MQRNRRDEFIRPVLRHQTFFHGVLASREHDVFYAHLLEAFRNRYGRENMASSATTYKKELFHAPLLA